jgi:putative heme-binding domain-containing protein
VLRNYENLSTLNSRVENGAAVFDKNCAQCHAYRGHGHAVGPNLAEFAGKGAPDFVQAILDPNSAINPNFIAYNIETKDGRSLLGIVRGETAGGLTVVQGGGLEENILRSELKEIRASQLSLMPEGLEQTLSPQELADLIGWVKQGAPAPFGAASANPTLAAKNRAEFLASGPSPITKVVPGAEILPYRSWLGTLPLAYCRQLEGASKLTWQSERRSPTRPGLPAAQSPVSGTETNAPASVTFRFAAAMGFASQPQGKFALKINERVALEFDVALADTTWASPDGRTRMAYTVIESNSEDSNGLLVIEVPATLAAAAPCQFEVTGSPSNSQRWFGIYQVAP